MDINITTHVRLVLCLHSKYVSDVIIDIDYVCWTQVKIASKRIDLSQVTSKCGSLDNAKHKPGGWIAFVVMLTCTVTVYYMCLGSFHKIPLKGIWSHYGLWQGWGTCGRRPNAARVNIWYGPHYYFRFPVLSTKPRQNEDPWWASTATVSKKPLSLKIVCRKKPLSLVVR